MIALLVSASLSINGEPLPPAPLARSSGIGNPLAPPLDWSLVPLDHRTLRAARERDLVDAQLNGAVTAVGAINELEARHALMIPTGRELARVGRRFPLLLHSEYHRARRAVQQDHLPAGLLHHQGRLCEDEVVGEVPVSVGDFMSHLTGSEVM